MANGVHLLLTHPLKAYDAVQLSIALVSNQRLIFVSADSTLLKAARNESLATANPNDYP
ncbi:MAG: type II toxin-antitoxin system VapC family toxin [Armatimonadetes bacterium]|nr:type II toxin-antitoxin system VapC family toxin [Armatimonadota bacterium]